LINKNQPLYSRLAALPQWMSLTVVAFVMLVYNAVLVPVLGLIVFSAWSGTLYTTYNLVQLNGLVKVLMFVAILILKDFDSILYDSAEASLSFLHHSELIMHYFCIAAPASGAMCFTIVLAFIVSAQYVWNLCYALVNKQKHLALVIPYHRTVGSFIMVLITFLIATFTQGGEPVLRLFLILGLNFGLVLVYNRRSIKNVFKF